MNFKQFKIVNVILAIIGVAAFLYFQESIRTQDKEPFKQGTSEYAGYHYAQENKLAGADQCKNAKDNAVKAFNAEFLAGCKRIFDQ